MSPCSSSNQNVSVTPSETPQPPTQAEPAAPPSPDPPTPEQQPLLSVTDYRPSANYVTSDEEDDEHHPPAQPAPNPFANLPCETVYGAPHSTRYSKGIWTEKPRITHLHSPQPLRLWTINGPDESRDDDEEQQIVYMDDNVLVYTKNIQMLRAQWEILNQRPGPPASVGKLSPLQKFQISVAHPVKPFNHAVIPLGNPLSLSRSCVVSVSGMINTHGRTVPDPPALSESSHSTHQTDSPYEQLSDEHSSVINFRLDSSSDDHHSESDLSDSNIPSLPAKAPAPTSPAHRDLGGPLHVPSPQAQAQIDNLTARVEQLLALNTHLQQQLSDCRKDKANVEQQLNAAKATENSNQSAPPRTSDSPSEERSPRRASMKKRRNAREDDRIRMELMEEKQRTAEMQSENERLLGVILKLKRELDGEHERNMALYETRFGAEPSVLDKGKQKAKSLLQRSRSASKDAKKKVEQRRRWIFGRTKGNNNNNNKSKKNDSS